MKIADWKKLAEKEQLENLLHFNWDNLEQGKLGSAIDSSDLKISKNKFETFLADKTGNEMAADLLDDFVSQEIKSCKEKSCAFYGVSVTGVSKFSALKTMSFFSTRPEVIGLPGLRIGDLAKAIKSAMNSQKDPFKARPEGNVRVATKREIDKSLRECIDRIRQRYGIDKNRENRSGTPASGGSENVATHFPSSPIWLTSTNALKKEFGLLPDGSSPEEKSGYAAGLKCALGLHSGRASENESDKNTDFDTISHYRVLVLLSFEKSPKKKFPVQPNIFSQGYGNLFISRRAEARDHPSFDGMAGRTVRLRGKRCHNHGPTCNCGAPGLPEAVMPTREAMLNNLEIDLVTAVFADDLKYVPPETNMIREKNPVLTNP